MKARGHGHGCWHDARHDALTVHATSQQHAGCCYDANVIARFNADAFICAATFNASDAGHGHGCWHDARHDALTVHATSQQHAGCCYDANVIARFNADALVRSNLHLLHLLHLVSLLYLLLRRSDPDGRRPLAEPAEVSKMGKCWGKGLVRRT